MLTIKSVAPNECLPEKKRKWIFYSVVISFFVIGTFVGYISGRGTNETAIKSESAPAEDFSKLKTCEVIERKQMEKLSSEYYADIYAFETNARIYADLAKSGCPKNAEKFKALEKRQMEIAATLRQGIFADDPYYHTFKDTSNLRTCEVIEQKKLSRLMRESDISHAEESLMNAEIYIDLIKYGCPENMEKFKELLSRQLKIAEAMLGASFTTENVHNNHYSYIRQVRILKELGDRNSIKQILEKARRLGEPAMQFINEIEQILAD